MKVDCVLCVANVHLLGDCSLVIVRNVVEDFDVIDPLTNPALSSTVRSATQTNVGSQDDNPSNNVGDADDRSVRQAVNLGPDWMRRYLDEQIGVIQQIRQWDTG